MKFRTKITGAPSAGQLSALHTLDHATTTLIRLFSPILPYVCDTLNNIFRGGEIEATQTVHARGNWPRSDDYADPTLHHELGEVVMEIVAGVRKVKTELGVSLRVPISMLFIAPEQEPCHHKTIQKLIAPVNEYMKEIAIADNMKILPSAPEGGATTLSPNQRLRISMRMSEVATERSSV